MFARIPVTKANFESQLGVIINAMKLKGNNMGKVLKIREVGDPILSIRCKEVEIKNINQEILK